MRCPACGSDTSAAFPQCGGCGASLDAPPGGDATVPDRPGGEDETVRDDQTVRDPLPGAPGLGEPLRPSWAPSGPPPGQWGASPGAPSDPSSPNDGATVHGPPTDQSLPAPGTFDPSSGETHTVLSPEPWAEQMWRPPEPPPPPERSKTPYFLAAMGGVLLLGVAVAIVFWPNGSTRSAQPTGDVPTVQQESPAAEETPSPSPQESGNLEEQAKAVDDLLNEMSTTRSELGGIVAAGCPTAGMRRILSMREEQLSKAQNLRVSAIDNGQRMKDALVRALEASAESNRRYVEVSPGCPPDSEVADVNQRASAAKNEFLGLWAPVAEEAGLPARSESDI